MIKNTISQAKFKTLEKLFNRKIKQLKGLAHNEEFEKFENTVTKSVLKGEKRAEEIIKNGHKFDNDQVSNILNEIDYEGFTHEPSKELLEELKQLERTKHNYVEFADKFGDYYLRELQKKVNR